MVCCDMLKELKRLNPAPVWVRQSFSVGIKLINGHHIFVRFDLPSCGTAGHNLDTDYILAQYGDVILDGREEMDTTMLAEIAASIAIGLNLRKEIKATEIYRQATLSMDIQWALSLGDKRKALDHLVDLLGSIGDYPDAEPLWSDWLLLAVKIATEK